MTARNALRALTACALACGLLPTAALAAPSPAPIEQETDGIIVTLSSDSLALLSSDAQSAQQAVEEALADEGIQVVDQVEGVEGEVLLVADAPEGTTDEEAAAAALGLPGVEAAQPNYVYELIEAVDEASLPALEESSPLALLAIAANDPFAQNSRSSQSYNQYWLYAPGSPSYGAGFVDAWKLVKTNHTVTVVEADSSVLASHQDLAANIAVDRVFDGTTGGYKSFSDYNPASAATGGHGTHVAGIIAGAANNGTGIAGGSYNASLAPIVLVNDAGKGSTASLVNCLGMAVALHTSNPTANVRVVNISAGGYSSNFGDTAVKTAIAAARRAGIVVVCAGGNGKGPTLSSPLYPSDLDDVVSVTSLTTTGGNITFSDYNKAKDISAPGESILSTTADGAYGYKTGTSMASPMVSATFALLFAAEPAATVDEAIAAVYNTASDINYNLSNSTDALRKAQTGSHGALNAGEAVGYLIANKEYSDISGKQWYNYDVAYATVNGIMSGNAGKFAPDDTMTRAQAAQVLYNRLGNGAKVPSQGYADVPANAWYAPAVNWAISEGYITGYNNRFSPEGTLTREQLATILGRASDALGKTDVSAANPATYLRFIDRNNTSDFAKEYLVWATDKGVITGVKQGNLTLLAPQTPITRAQMATMMKRCLEGDLL